MREPDEKSPKEALSNALENMNYTLQRALHQVTKLVTEQDNDPA